MYEIVSFNIKIWYYEIQKIWWKDSHYMQSFKAQYKEEYISI